MQPAPALQPVQPPRRPRPHRIATALAVALVTTFAPIGVLGASGQEGSTPPATTTPSAPAAVSVTPDPATGFVGPSLAAGTGTAGSFVVPVTSSVSGDVRLSFSGLAPGITVPNPDDPTSPITGTIEGTDEKSYVVDLPRPSPLVLARFEIDVSNPAAGVELSIYRADGTPVGTPVDPGPAFAAQEIFAPALVTPYTVTVRSVGPATDFVVRAFASTTADSAGSQSVTPSVIAAEAGTPTSFTYQWSGLPANAVYVAAVGYGFGAGVARYTTLRIDAITPDVPAVPVNLVRPVITGSGEVSRTLRATTGDWDTGDLTFSYQWQSNGADIAGATRARYRVTNVDRGSALSVVVTGQSAGGARASASSEPVVVKYASDSTIRLSRSVVPVGQKVTVTVTVRSVGPVPGTARVLIGDQPYVVVLNDHGSGRVTVSDLAVGRYTVSAQYGGSDVVAGSSSNVERLRVTR